MEFKCRSFHLIFGIHTKNCLLYEIETKNDTWFIENVRQPIWTFCIIIIYIFKLLYPFSAIIEPFQTNFFHPLLIHHFCELFLKRFLFIYTVMTINKRKINNKECCKRNDHNFISILALYSSHFSSYSLVLMMKISQNDVFINFQTF